MSDKRWQAAAAIGALLDHDLEHGTDCYAERAEGPWHVPLRPVCHAAGLAWPAERRRIKAHPVLAAELRQAVVSVGPGRSRRIACLPVRLIGFWLATAEVAAIRDPERRERLLRYQRQCVDALAGGGEVVNHWLAERPGSDA